MRKFPQKFILRKTPSVPGVSQGAGDTAVNEMGEMSAFSEGTILRSGWGGGVQIKNMIINNALWCTIRK